MVYFRCGSNNSGSSNINNEEITLTRSGSNYSATLTKDYKLVYIVLSGSCRHDSGSASLSFACRYNNVVITNNTDYKLYSQAGGNSWDRGGSAIWLIKNAKKNDTIMGTIGLSSGNATSTSIAHAYGVL